MKLTLRARLAVIATVVFGVLIGALAVASYGVLARQLDRDASTRLEELTEGLHGYLRFHGDTLALEFDAADGDQVAFVQEASRYYQVYDAASGRRLFQSNAIVPLGLALTPDDVRRRVAVQDSFDVSTAYGRLRVSNSIVTDAASTPYLLQVGVSLVPTDAAVRRYRDLLLFGVPACLLLAGLGSWWLSAFALAPLSRFAAAARHISVHTLERRLPTRPVDDELEDVARAFNGALARLEHAVGEMRQFSAALAHELRTPLAALRGEIELALRDASADPQRDRLASQIETIDQLKRLIEQILTLARAESGQIPLTFTRVDVGGLAASLVEQLEPVAQARGIALTCERRGAAVVDGDEEWLRRLLINLIDNALKFTKTGGLVTVAVGGAEAGGAVVRVQDNGVGIAQEDRPHVFERFFRADPARSSTTEGAGLGLSLVQWIVERHRGTVDVESEVGAGTTFIVTLPPVPSTAAPYS